MVMTASQSERRSINVRLMPVVVAGGYAWFVSVFPIVQQAGLWSVSGLSGLGAALCLVLAPFGPTRAVALFLSLHGFLAACLCSWLTAQDVALPPGWQLYGALGWLGYTIALGVLSTPDRAFMAPSEASGLFVPRVRPSLVAATVFLLSVVSTLGLLILALRIERPALSILAQLSALFVGLLVLQGAVHLSHYFQRRGSQKVFSPHVGGAVWFLLVLAFVLGGGLLGGWLEH